MNLYGYFETLLQSRFSADELVVRNFGYPGDEVGLRQRSGNYTSIDDPLQAFGPDTFFCFFGYNESFAGQAGLEKFQKDYDNFLKEYAKTYPRDDTGVPPRFVLVSPTAVEPTGDPLYPDAPAQNANLKLYAAAVAKVAKQHGLAFVDVFTATEQLFAAEPGPQFTINGCHLNEAGDRAVALLLDQKLFPAVRPVDMDVRAIPAASRGGE